ncbi:MAG: hypothetical protein JW699_06960 [Chitinispirillaceae bacterium]|nr:hypothetical protein [Chitinispirillaceae bacterium]
MIRRLSMLLIVAATAACVCSCGFGPLAGGSGTETVNTFALLADGSPAKGAIVRVIDPQWWIDSVRVKASPVILRTVVDVNGRFSFTPPDDRLPLNLQIDHSDQGIFLQSITGAKLTGDTLRLRPYATYTGKFPTSAHAITQMFLSGSTYQASIGSDGSFFFNAVAPGAYTLVGLSGAPLPYRIATCGAITLVSGTAVTSTTLNPSFDRLLVDNFESGFGPTSLGGIAPELWWYTVSDSGMLAWKRATDTWKWTPYSGHTFTALEPVTDERGGTAVRFSAVLDSSISSPIATAGVFFKDRNKNGIDLSAMTGCSLRCRGRGTLRVRFESRILDSISLYLSAYSYLIALTGSWQEITIPVDSLRILDPVFFPSQYPWSQESKNVLRFEFEFSVRENAARAALWVDLDDLYFEGVSVDVLQR